MDEDGDAHRYHDAADARRDVGDLSSHFREMSVAVHAEGHHRPTARGGVSLGAWRDPAEVWHVSVLHQFGAMALGILLFPREGVGAANVHTTWNAGGFAHLRARQYSRIAPQHSN